MIRLLVAALSVLSLSSLNPAPAQAQNFFSYVSSLSGSDSNNCAGAYVTSGPDKPCNAIYYAVTKTLDGGTVTCVDPGDHVQTISFGGVPRDDYTVTITNALTIDCNAGGGARDIYSVVINAPGKQVSLRNLTINPLRTSYSDRPAIRIIAASSVDLENVVISGSNQSGIRDERSTAGSKLSIRNSIIVGHSGPGIVLVPQGSGSINAVIDNVSVRDTNYGLAVAARARAMVSRSVFAQNFVAGIEADPGGIIEIENTLISNNATGIVAVGGSNITLANSGVNSNNVAISGATRSYGNNRFFANAASIGTAPAPIGVPSGENGLR